MKNIYYLLLIFPIFIFGQSSDQNYIKSTVYKQETIASISNPDIEQANVQINYFDGLGRAIQQIAHKQSSSGKNVIVHIEYDEFGRQVKEFLPYVSQTSSLDFDSGAQSNQLNYYSTSIDPNFETTTTPFSEKILDFSPLNKVLKQTAPGDAWKKDSGHEIKFDYDVNTLVDEVFNLSANRTAGSTGAYNYNLVCAGYHNPNTLYKNVIKDENWVSGKNNTTEEYKNDLGRVVLKRAYNNSQKHDTYYVYDIVGNLIYVVPPLASDNIAQVQSNTTPYVFNQGIGFSQFIIDSNGAPITNGGGGMTISIQNSNISLSLSGSWGGSGTFDLTKQFEINAIYPIPDMTLGYVDFNYNGNHQFIAKIANNKLYFEDNTPSEGVLYFSSLPSITQNLTKPLSPSLFQNIITYTYSMNFYEIENLGYQYKYDNRNRLVSKKLPGKQWEYIVYDKLDRPVATGPAFSPYGDGSNGWMITQYDVFGRVTQTGWKNATVTDATRSTNQTSVNNGSNPFGLTANQVLTKNYYDNYTFTGAPSTIPTTLPYSTLPVANNVKGMPTGSWVKVLDNVSSTAAEVSYILYDTKYRPVHSKVSNYLGGYTQVDNNMDWSGKTIYTLTKHKRTDADNELVIKDMFQYSPQDYLIIHKQQINGLPEQLITKNSYDELGQLISKNVGGNDVTGATSLQKVDYTYNIRGWLKAINDVNTIGNDLFAFKINYNDAETATDLYNGNISETFWKTKSDNIKRKYDYTYDHLNRLLQADYSKEGSITFNSYLEHLTYDKNGNIQTLLRNGDMDTDGYQFEQIIDDLVYTYHPQNKNLLEKVIDKSIAPQGFNESYDLNSGDCDGIDDATIDYSYDLNGNMLTDANKGIENIIYNHLNLPVEIAFQNGKINYLYNAVGQKIEKIVTESITTTTEYLSGFQYKNAVLQFFPHAEGYVNASENATIGGGTSYTFNYVFNFTDHLGNIRLSYSKDPVTNVLKIIEETHYYPFGLKQTGYNSDKMIYSKEGSILKIKPVPPLFKTIYTDKFNGQSWETDLGLNITAMDYRQYDNALGRFNSMDVLSELAPHISTYRFAFNNPVYWSDPSGLYEIDKNGNIKITNEDEIKNFLSFLKNNSGASVKDMSEHIFNADNGFALELNEVVVVGNKKTRTYSDAAISGAANNWFSQIQSSQNKMNNFNGGVIAGEDFYHSYSDIANSANGIGIGLGVKQELFGFAVAQNYKTATNPWNFAKLKETQQAWRTTNTLGKTGSKLLSATKVLGVATSVVQVGVKGYEIYNKGYKNATVRDWADLGVNSAGVVAAVFFASNPIGWAVGGAALIYSVGTTIYDMSKE